MKVPARIRIGAIWFDIEVQDDDWVRRSDAIAQLDRLGHKILLAPQLEGEALYCSFMHELFHAAVWLQNACCSDDRITEEDGANACGYMIPGILAANPDVARWLNALLEEG